MDTLPSLHCFGRLFSTYNRRAVPRHSRRAHSPFLTGRAASHRIYGTYGGRYVLWLIVLLSLTYFQFTAAARHFASWLSIVRDERRFMCHPGLYLSLRSPRVLFARRLSSIGHDKRHFLVTKKKSVLSHRREKKYLFDYLIRNIKMLSIACMFRQRSLLLRTLRIN